jgi:hypothetical protein
MWRRLKKERGMNFQKHILGSLFVTATLLPSYAAAADKPWWVVTELKQDGVSKCDTGTNTWFYKVTWKPIIYENRPWPKYIVGGNGCYAPSTYTCTAELCKAQLSGCTTKISKSWAGVTADIGKKIQGERTPGAVWKPADCVYQR